MQPFIIVLLLLTFSSTLLPRRAAAQEHETAVLILNLEKLNQLREILQRMYDGYKLVSDGYGKIKKLTSGNFELHDLFLDGLLLVSPTVKKYHRITDIIAYQLRIVREYKRAYNRFAHSGAFDPEQLVDLTEVYAKLFNDSLKSLDELLMIVTARTLRMSDDDRLRAVDRIFGDVEQQLAFLQKFNTQQTMVAIERTRDKAELGTLKALYGLDK